MNLLTGFMQFFGDDKKNIKALVNTFFHGYGTEQTELLICLFELQVTAYVYMFMYIKFASVWIVVS